MSDYIIFDIDGTISDTAHRVHHAQMKDWDTFQSLAHEDPVIVKMADLMRMLSLSANVILLTGRNEKYRHVTKQWLADASLDYAYEELLMRPDGDFRHDAEMKLAMLEERFGGKDGVLANVWFAIDDRDTVVEAFRNYGILTLQPCAGGY